MCATCEDIYYNHHTNKWSLDVCTYEWNDRADDYNYVTLEINFCYECGKDYRNE
jgi:hypothetical protein